MRDFKISDRVKEIKPLLFEKGSVLDIVDIRMVKSELQVGVVLKGSKPKQKDIIYSDYKKFKRM